MDDDLFFPLAMTRRLFQDQGPIVLSPHYFAPVMSGEELLNEVRALEEDVERGFTDGGGI